LEVVSTQNTAPFFAVSFYVRAGGKNQASRRPYVAPQFSVTNNYLLPHSFFHFPYITTEKSNSFKKISLFERTETKRDRERNKRDREKQETEREIRDREVRE
jgi:hypothetical protein